MAKKSRDKREISQALDEILDMSVADFLKKYKPPSTVYITVKPKTKIYNIMKALATGHPTIIVVVDENRKPIGYITDSHLLLTLNKKPRIRSILAAFAYSQIPIPIEKSLNISVSDIMDRKPPVVSLDNKIRDVVKTMESLSIPAVIVVDKDGRIRAVLTRRFLLKAIINYLLGEPLLI